MGNPLTIRQVKLNITSSLVVENTNQFFHRIIARECTLEFEIQRKNNNSEFRLGKWQMPPQVGR